MKPDQPSEKEGEREREREREREGEREKDQIYVATFFVSSKRLLIGRVITLSFT